jgi:hypothetical protein
MAATLNALMLMLHQVDKEMIKDHVQGRTVG